VRQHQHLVWIKIQRLRQLPLESSSVKDSGVKTVLQKRYRVKDVPCTSLQRLFYLFAPFPLRCQDFHQQHHPQPTFKRAARLEGRPTAAVLICKFNPINCDKGCQRRNKKSIPETFFGNFNDSFSSSEARMECSGSSYFQMFAVLMVTDYCC